MSARTKSPEIKNLELIDTLRHNYKWQLWQTLSPFPLAKLRLTVGIAFIAKICQVIADYN
jgi:hypothetical protein